MAESKRRSDSIVPEVDGRDRVESFRCSLDPILGATVDQIFVLDQDGCCLYVNAAGAHSLGLPTKQIIGRTWRDLGIPIELMEHCDRRRAQVFASGETLTGETRLPTSEGVRDCDYILSPMRAADGTIEAVVVTVHDISHHKSIEGDLRASVDRQAAVATREQQGRIEAERLALERAAVLGQMTDGVVLVAPDGKITLVNEAARRLLGVTSLRAADVLVDGESSTLEFFASDGSPYPLEDLPLRRAVASGETVADAELRIRRKDGTEIEIQASATPVVGKNGNRLGGVLLFRDVTAPRAFERQKGEFIATISHELRTPLTVIKGQAQYLARRIGRADSADGNAILPRLSTIDGTVTRLTEMVNGLIEVTQGTPAQLAPGSTPLTAGLPPKSHQLRVVQQIAGMLVKELDLERVADVIAEQSFHLCNAASAGVYVVDRSRRELHLLARHGIKPLTPRAQRTLSALPMDAPTFASVAARTGRSVEIRDLAAIGPEFEISCELAREEGLQSVLAQPLYARGHLVGVLTTLFTTPHTFVPEERELIGAMGDLWSIAIDNARLYREAQEAIQQSTDLERLRDEWVSLIAHDLRQPATVITGYVDLLMQRLERCIDLIRERQLLDHIGTAARNLDQMVGDLLDVSRIETRRLTIESRPIDLAALAHDVVDRAETMTRGHTIRLQIHDDIPPIHADPTRVEQMLGNLLANAAKYGYPTTSIWVDLARQGDLVEVSVTNLGDGIPPGEQSKLFGRFHRSGQAAGQNIAGLGLGLYITKGLVEAHGGRIWVESLPTHATTFHFVLPISGQPS
jgi:PAS domain S-box-containing protein